MRIDSCFASLEEAIRGTPAPRELIDTLELFTVSYYSFDGELCQGQGVLRRDLVPDVVDAYALMRKIRFPIGKVVPIVRYGWDDEASARDNNSSGFCYRFKVGKDELSNHASCAWDINPMQNPFYGRTSEPYPKGSSHNSFAPGTLLPDGEVVRFFLGRGWTWGAVWTSVKDFHHFEKP